MAWIEQRGTRYRVRIRTTDGTVTTDSIHPTRTAAILRAKQIDIDEATDTYLDPARGRITLATWVSIWEPGHIAGPAKWAAYRSHLRNHILPAFGSTPLTRIHRQDVKLFAKRLAGTHADSTVASIIGLLSMLMREAVTDRRIPFNPCQNIRARTGLTPERPHATAAQVNTIASRADRRADQILIITAAYTGMRWGELAGLTRAHTHLDDGVIHIDPAHGALHEVAGRLELGPPKTRDSAREIHLPPFLVQLLRETLDSHDHNLVFTAAGGGYLRRSNFNRRVHQPSVNATAHHPAVIAGMHFHDYRHTHKTWLIEDDIPEIAQAKRLGHRIPGIRGVYSHVTPTMIERITTVLQHRWNANQPPPATAGVVIPIRRTA